MAPPLIAFLLICLSRRPRLLSHLLLALSLTGLPKVLAAESPSDRDCSSLNEGWRFHMGDPDAKAATLIYDVRPEVTDTRDDIAADSKPREAQQAAVTRAVVLKPWILPSANAFIKDPAHRHTRPAGDPGSDVACLQADYDDHAWTSLSLPHDWAITTPFLEKGDFGGMGRLCTWGAAWYRRKLDIPASDQGRRILLNVDGAMSYASVWLNGHLVGGWPYGYASWQLDLTPYVKPGAVNQLALRLDPPPSSARWYPGAGLFRRVWLEKTAAVHVAHWGTQVLCREVSAASAAIELAVKVSNDQADGAAEVEIETLLYTANAAGKPKGSAVASFPKEQLRLPPASSQERHQCLRLPSPRLWGPMPEQTPQLYVAVTTLRVGGKPVDRYETPFGIRDLRWDPSRGLLINGQHIVIRGVNQHHDLGALGSAFNLRAAQRQLELLREAGCNAIRTSHNPPAPELLALADRMGFLVLDEIFDCWERMKTPLDFHLIFPDWHEADLRAFIRRDRNHPSVILWSVGNEVGEQYTDAAGAAIARELCRIAAEEDPSRPATCAMNYASPDMPLPAELGVIGLNYQGEGIRWSPEFVGTERIRKAPQYDAFHQRFPGKVILSTETASAFSSRGVYLFPVTSELSAPVRDGRGGDSTLHQVSAYELHAVDFGSSAEKVFAALDAHPYVAGQFVWTGWDHLGEPTPYYSSRGAYCGFLDMAGFPKDRFYLYQSYWRPQLPMAHILPHWTWPERVGQVTPVHVFTTGDEAELFINGRSLGKRHRQPGQYRLRWDEVVYEPGSLRVIAYRNGQPWAEDTVDTAGPAARLELSADRSVLAADGEDLCFVTVRVVDRDGHLVPRADTQLDFSVAGAAEFVAADNGDQTSFEPFATPVRRAFNGLCLLIVRSRKGQDGPIVVRVKGVAVGEASLRVQSLPVAP